MAIEDLSAAQEDALEGSGESAADRIENVIGFLEESRPIRRERSELVTDGGVDQVSPSLEFHANESEVLVAVDVQDVTAIVAFNPDVSIDHLERELLETLKEIRHTWRIAPAARRRACLERDDVQENNEEPSTGHKYSTGESIDSDELDEADNPLIADGGRVVESRERCRRCRERPAKKEGRCSRCYRDYRGDLIAVN